MSRWKMHFFHPLQEFIILDGGVGEKNTWKNYHVEVGRGRGGDSLPSLPSAIEVWGKVIFSQALSLCPMERGFASKGGWADTLPIRYYEIRSTSGRYASYWNAFLFRAVFIRHIAVVYLRSDFLKLQKRERSMSRRIVCLRRCL